MIFLIVVYVFREGFIDIYTTLTTCRIFLDQDYFDYLEFEDTKNILDIVSDFLDALTFSTILYLFHYYL